MTTMSNRLYINQRL